MGEDLAFDWDAANIEHIRGHRITPDEVAHIFLTH
jgi:hypothetical protein